MDERKIAQRKFNVHAHAEDGRNYSLLLLFPILYFFFITSLWNIIFLLRLATKALKFFKIYEDAKFKTRNIKKKGENSWGL